MIFIECFPLSLHFMKRILYQLTYNYRKDSIIYQNQMKIRIIKTFCSNKDFLFLDQETLL